MLIDWFTVIAQVVNFLILVWLLKRLLYRPILNAIDAREKRIASELADAGARMAEATREREEFQHKNETFDRERALLISQATDEAKTERQRLLDEARKAAEDLTAKRLEALRSEAHNLDQALGRRVREEVFAIARKTLDDLADASLEERMTATFVRRLRAIDADVKAGLVTALKSGAEPLRVCSAFELPAAQRAAIQQVLDDIFATSVAVRYETHPGLVSGIELGANGQKVAWSISDYLSSLESGVDELLKAKVRTSPAHAKPGTKQP
jgi:F-type H+-transporting ATPase subunit b